MSIPFPGKPPYNGFSVFDLGLDRLANTDELEHIEDPWSPTHDEAPEPRFPAPLNMPTPGLGHWADELQLPGI